MNDWPSIFLHRMTTWSARDFVWAALLVLLFTLGSTGNLFATVTIEAEATCESADIIRVRVGDLHFNLPKERQVKLASKRKQLVFLVLFRLVPEKRRVTQKLDGKSAIGPAHTYCQEKPELAADVFGFGLVPNRGRMQGLQGELSKSLEMLCVSKIESTAEERRRDILLREKGEVYSSAKTQSLAELHQFNVTIQEGHPPIFQYFLKLGGSEGRVFLIECSPIAGTQKPRKQCSFLTLVGQSVGLSGQFFTDVLPQELWAERLQQVDVWYQGLLQLR